MSQDNADSVPGTHSTPKPKPDPEHLVGKVLGQRYAIDRCIGRGGMGVVYLATQQILGRKVVVKVLPRGLLDNATAVARFEREARGMSQLQHANIVSIHDFGRENGRAYIVMEYIDGETLADFMERNGPMDEETFVPLATQILHALGEAHSQGLIHRDIKPANIMLCHRHGLSNFVKILDFGLAKLVEDDVKITKELSLLGSIAYMAPERLSGEEVTLSADVYALGVMFYFMLAGKKPFDGDTEVALIFQHMQVDPPPLEELLPPQSEIPAGLVKLIHRCLEKSPAARPADANAVLEAMVDCVPSAADWLPTGSGHWRASRNSAASQDEGSASAPTVQLPTVADESSDNHERITAPSRWPTAEVGDSGRADSGANAESQAETAQPGAAHGNPDGVQVLAPRVVTHDSAANAAVSASANAAPAPTVPELAPVAGPGATADVSGSRPAASNRGSRGIWVIVIFVMVAIFAAGAALVTYMVAGDRIAALFGASTHVSASGAGASSAPTRSKPTPTPATPASAAPTGTAQPHVAVGAVARVPTTFHLRPHTLKVEGSVPAKIVLAGIERQQHTLAACLSELPAGRPARGDQVLQFTVSDSTNKVLAAVVRNDGVHIAALNRCLTRAMKSWTFPDAHATHLWVAMFGVHFAAH